ncbi:phosphoribosyltransferase [Roseomonas sp. JC162]|uniref:Phosphoribosyltransferase n=1 Tax=Neoroseomonas marina TaxID=1232220 RepID=A0A848EG05_9PROT|nr:phosphoribosyltransferase family protein [Neoroseomonas marina]NMJ42370.1 phosphoribosyltransferase [Neoroseomonas marina]
MWRGTLFRDRREAGERLIPLLAPLGLKDALVYGLLRGGIAVAAPVAEGLKVPLLPFLVRKLGVPWQPELGFGALAEGADAPVLNRDIVAGCGLDPDDIATVETHERHELERRQALYLAGLRRPEPRGRAVILVDDGLATGVSARAALRSLRGQGASPLILAIPVAPASSIASLEGECDRIVCAEISDIPAGIGGCYADFHQLEDEEVLAILRGAGKEAP